MSSIFKKLFYQLVTNRRYKSADYHSQSKKDFYEKRLYPRTLKGALKLNQLHFYRIESESDFKFKDFDFGVSAKNIAKLMGDPNYFLSKDFKEFSYHVFFYKEVIEGFKIITQVHFIDEVMFLASYSYEGDLKQSRNTIAELLIRKQIPDYVHSKDELDLIMEDNAGNTLVIENDVVFRCSYFTGNEKLHKKVQQIINHQEKLYETEWISMPDVAILNI